MNLIKRIAKKLARRVRPKGVVAKTVKRPGRNRQPLTAVDLWRRSYRFSETKPARAGTKRRLKRERQERRKRMFA